MLLFVLLLMVHRVGLRLLLCVPTAMCVMRVLHLLMLLRLLCVVVLVLLVLVLLHVYVPVWSWEG